MICELNVIMIFFCCKSIHNCVLIFYQEIDLPSGYECNYVTRDPLLSDIDVQKKEVNVSLIFY